MRTAKTAEHILLVLLVVSSLQLVLFHGNLRLGPFLTRASSLQHIAHRGTASGISTIKEGPERDGFLVDEGFWRAHFVEPVGRPFPDSVIHIHHACMKGNMDGVFIHEPRPRQQDLDPVYEHSPVQLKRLSEANVEWLGECSVQQRALKRGECMQTLRGVTLMSNCWRQEPTSTNPMHLLHQVVHIFELSRIHSDTVEGHTAPPLPAVRNLALHQCPSYRRLTDGTWGMGSFLWSLLANALTTSGLWSPPQTTERLVAGSVVDLSESSGWTCFEDIYLDRRYGSMAPARQRTPEWRAHVLRMVGTKDNAHENATEETDRAALRERCDRKAVRVHVYQRKQGDGKSGDRAFTNLEDVLQLVQNFTEEPVRVLTTHGQMSPRDQAEVFRGFDLLVTPHGSHLMNMLFESPYTGIVEVGPVNHDSVFSKGARQLGIRSYRFSTGHQPVCAGDAMPYGQFAASLEKNCTYDSEDGLGWRCSKALSFQYVVCDMTVDLERLRNHVSETMNGLCAAATLS